MSLLERIKEAGIVGCGGAGFPTHVKLNCTVEYLIINGAECEPLLRTDRWIMKNKAEELVEMTENIAQLVGATKLFIGLKETYTAEIEQLEKAIERRKSPVQIYRMKNFYPAGDEQSMVCDITGRSVPPGGIPLDVDTVVTNVGTLYAIWEAEGGKNFTHKYLTLSGEVANPVVLHVPIGISFSECLEAGGGALLADYRVISGGPLMGEIYTKERAEESLFVTKTTSGFLLVPKDAELVRQKETSIKILIQRGKSACVQCTECTALCPRYLSGHPLEPHRIMRRLSNMEDITQLLDDPCAKQALICSECGICETYACPMGLLPRQVNILLKKEFAKANIRYEKGAEPQKRETLDWRRTPSKRLAKRIGVGKYYDYEINDLLALQTDKVRIPLKQHIGAAAEPVVQVNDRVRVGQLIGKIPENAIGANIHASLDGVVTSMNNGVIIIERGGR